MAQRTILLVAVGLVVASSPGQPRPAPNEAPPDLPSESLPPGDRVTVDAGGLIDMRFNGTELFLALELLSEQTQRNIVVHSGVTGSVSLVLRRVTFQQALETILSTQGLTASEVGNVIHVYGKPASSPETQAPVEMRLFRLNYISAVEVEAFIKPLLSEAGKVSRTSEPERGIAPSSEEAGGFTPANPDVLVVVDRPTYLRRIAEAVAELDRRPQQILVEATIMRTTLTEQNSLGIDFNTLAGVNFELLEAQSPGVGSIALGTIPQNELRNTNVAVRTELTGQVPGGGFTFGIVKDQVAAFIRALELVTDVTILANPKVLTLNRQRGEVIVGRRDGYITTTVTETAAIQTVNFLETGTKLTFRPFATRDGYVRMEVHPEDSNGGLSASNLPFEETTEATTNVLLKDGHTILIGGLFRERSTAGRSQVPVLGNIPGLGKLFSVQNDQTTREEVIILLTVHVLDAAEDDAQFLELDDDIERIRAGARDGLMGSGRELLAEGRYQAAVAAAQRGAIDEALTALDWTLHLHPRHFDALRLRERLLRERTWTADGSLNRSFIHESLRRQAGLGRGTQFGRPDLDAVAPPDEAPTTQPVDPAPPGGRR